MSNIVTDLIVAAKRAMIPTNLKPAELEKRRKILCEMMDKCTTMDFGFREDDNRLKCDKQSEECKVKPPNHAISLYNDLELEVKVFFIPVGQRIPLHDHEGMTVF